MLALGLGDVEQRDHLAVEARRARRRPARHRDRVGGIEIVVAHAMRSWPPSSCAAPSSCAEANTAGYAGRMRSVVALQARRRAARRAGGLRHRPRGDRARGRRRSVASIRWSAASWDTRTARFVTADAHGAAAAPGPLRAARREARQPGPPSGAGRGRSARSSPPAGGRSSRSRCSRPTMRRRSPATWRSAPRDAAGLGAAVDWKNNGWPDWAYYQPIAQAALDAGVPIVAANLTPATARALARGQRAALPANLAERYALDRPPLGRAAGRADDGDPRGALRSLPRRPGGRHGPGAARARLGAGREPAGGAPTAAC